MTCATSPAPRIPTRSFLVFESAIVIRDGIPRDLGGFFRSRSTAHSLMHGAEERGYKNTRICLEERDAMLL